MRITEIITEALDKPYPWERSMDAGYFRSADGEIITVQFDDMTEFAPGIWSVSFSKNFSTKLSGARDEFRIFSTVIAIIQQWASQAKPKILTFSADKSEGVRGRLYKKLVDRVITGSDYTDVSSNISVIKDEKLRMGCQKIQRAYSESSAIFILARNDQITF